MQTFWKTLNTLLIAGILAVGLLLLGTMMPIPGNFKVKIVKSGSMEPTIKTGGIVFIKPEKEYHVGDIVTFGADTKTQIPTTHRIIAIGEVSGIPSISTKGDANDSPDQKPTALADVHGKVIFALPYVGYLLDFAKKPIGFALLVGLPALLVIIDEIGKIIAEVRRMRREKRGKTAATRGSEPEASAISPSSPRIIASNEPRAPIGLTRWTNDPNLKPSSLPLASVPPMARRRTAVRKVPLYAIVAFMLPVLTFFAASSVGGTVSYFADVEYSLANFLKADPLGFTVVASSEQIDMGKGSAEITLTLLPDADSEPLQYSASALMTSGDTTLCGLIVLDSASSFGYSGPLLTLAMPMTTRIGALPITFSIPDGYAPSENTHCFVDLTFVARNADAPLGSGYTDTQHLSLQFFVPARGEDPSVAPAASPFSSPVDASGTEIIEKSEATTTDASSENLLPQEGSPTTTEEVAPELLPVPEIPGEIPASPEPAPTDPPPAA